MALKIATLNANGLRNANKGMGVLQWLSHFAFDVVKIQESYVVSLEECMAILFLRLVDPVCLVELLFY